MPVQRHVDASYFNPPPRVDWRQNPPGSAAYLIPLSARLRKILGTQREKDYCGLVLERNPTSAPFLPSSTNPTDHMKRFSIVLLLLLFAALSAPACSDDSASSGDTSSPDITSDAQIEGDAGDVAEDGLSEDAVSADAGPADVAEVEEDPYEGLRDNALKSALRQTNRRHRDLGYGPARDFMFEYDMANVGAVGQIECVYTGRKAFVDGRLDAQNQNPMYNTEHTWPQSRGASGVARSDLHHLFITDGAANGKRGSVTFGEVVNASWSEGGSKLGSDSSGHKRFEPRDVHKGNVARAIFYFAVTYNHQVSAAEEAALRAWHVQDPVDDAERARNDAIEGIQRSRNFFIDRPDLVDSISNF